MTYFDNAATTALSESVRTAMMDVMEHTYGNPSSLHGIGMEAERVIKNADKTIRALLGLTQGDLLWTSSGTEANNLAVLGTARANAGRGKRVITSSVEHPSVTDAFTQLSQEGFDVVVLSVDENGQVNADALADAVDAHTTLVSIMHVNNETGVVQDIEKLACAAKKKNNDVLFHCDAVQSFGKHPLYPARWGVDLMTASAHKIHGPKGSGMLYARFPARLKPILFGGGQQKGIRPGTENVIGIAGFAQAAQDAFAGMDAAFANAFAVREKLLQVRELVENVRINSPLAGSPYILNLSFAGVRAEVLLHALESEGYAVSAGSACSSKHKYSQVLVNHGFNIQRAEESIRISLCAGNTVEEADGFLTAAVKQVQFLRKYGGVRR